MSWRLSIAITILLVSSISCDALFQDEEDTDLSFLLLALVNEQCTIGTTVFATTGDVTCSNNSASGTGTLIAAEERSEVVSMDLNFQLGDSGSIDLVSGVDSNTTLASGAGATLNIPASGVSRALTDSSGGTSAAGTTEQVWCLEHHVGENPIHMILDLSACSSKAASAASYEDDSTGPNAAGGKWGIVLNDATIHGLTRHNSNQFND